MGRRVDVTFPMTRQDLLFLDWMLSFKKRRPHEPRDLVGHWSDLFQQALKEHFPEGEDEATSVADEISGDPQRGHPLLRVSEFADAFDADGCLRGGDGALRVVFLDRKDRRHLGTLRF